MQGHQSGPTQSQIVVLCRHTGQGRRGAAREAVGLLAAQVDRRLLSVRRRAAQDAPAPRRDVRRQVHFMVSAADATSPAARADDEEHVDARLQCQDERRMALECAPDSSPGVLPKDSWPRPLPGHDGGATDESGEPRGAGHVGSELFPLLGDRLATLVATVGEHIAALEENGWGNPDSVGVGSLMEHVAAMEAKFGSVSGDVRDGRHLCPVGHLGRGRLAPRGPDAGA